MTNTEMSASQECTQTQTQYTQDSQFSSSDDTIIANETRNPWGRICVQKIRPKVSLFYGGGNAGSHGAVNDYIVDPRDADLSSHDLIETKWKAGRAQDVDFTISRNEMPESEIPKLSKIQFSLRRDLSHPFNPTILDDCSTNGTYINQVRVGKGHSRILRNGDIISIISPKFPLFRFVDLQLNYAVLELPSEITSHYYVGPKLGSGGCGEVTKVYNVKSCQPFALKMVKKCRFSDMGRSHPNNPTRILNEIEILKKLNHPCVIGMHEIVDQPDAVYMFLELMNGGDLCQRIMSQPERRLPENLSRLYFLQTCYAVRYLHSQKITHRDIKPDNILLYTHEMITLVKVTDFGLSKFVRKNSIMNTQCGTPQYAAPEVLNNKEGAYTKKVDIWSLGVMLYTCLCGNFPFVMKRGKKYVSFDSDCFKKLSNDVKTVICDCLKINVAARPRIEDLLKYKWLQDNNTIMAAKGLMKEYVESTTRADSQEELDVTVVTPSSSSSHTTDATTVATTPRIVRASDNDELPDKDFMEPPAKRIRVDVEIQ